LHSNPNNIEKNLSTMFVLKPDGESASGSSPSQLKTASKFFGKLGLYFVAIRAAHVYFGASAEETSK
jgi:hypothetical protein